MKNTIESIGFEETDELSYAPTLLIHSLLRKDGVYAKIDELLPVSNVPNKMSKLQHSDSIAKLLTHYLMNYHRMSQMELMDPNYTSPSFNSCISHYTIKNRIKELVEKPDVERLTKTVNSYRKNGKIIKGKKKKERLIPIYRLSANGGILKLFDFLQFFPKNEILNLDADVTCINTQSADSSRHYQGKSGYAPLLIMVNRIPIYVEMRTGKVHAGLYVAQAVIHIVGELKKLGYTVGSVRLDAAGYTKANVEAFENLGLKYYIRASKSKATVEGMNPIIVKVGDREVAYKDILKKFGQKMVRYIYNNDNATKRTVAIITNDHDMKDPADVVYHYRQRGTEEQTMSLLNAFGFHTMVFRSIRNNAAFLVYSVIMVLLFRYVTRKYSLALGNETLGSYCTVKTFQNLLLKVSGRLEGDKLIIKNPRDREIFDRLLAA